MKEHILASSYSEDSRRHAILADNGQTGILYLHAPSDDRERIGKVEATCFAYNREDPIDPTDVQRYHPNPPPIAKGCASKDAVCRKPKSHTWGLIWSTDGEAVLLLQDDTPWAIVSRDHRRGCSRAVEAQGPWGGPWSDAVFEATEWKG